MSETATHVEAGSLPAPDAKWASEGAGTSHPVAGPAHYRGRSGRQSIEITHAYRLGPDLTQAVDYILRAGRKTPDPRQDLAKAAFYLRYAVRVPAGDRAFGPAYAAAPRVATIVADFGITCKFRASALALALGLVPSIDELRAAADCCDRAIAAWEAGQAGGGAA